MWTLLWMRSPARPPGSPKFGGVDIRRATSYALGKSKGVPMDLPFNGAISHYLKKDAPKEVRKAIETADKDEILSKA